MITRKLLAALVGLSLAAGTLGTASAQTSAPLATQSVSPSDAAAPTTAAKSDTMKKAPVRKSHHARMTSKIHRKHVSSRATKHAKVATTSATSKRLASKRIGTKVSSKLTGKRIRVSHAFKRGLTKHV